ncbi:Disease resistance protein L6 [Linum perenne]
MMSMRRSLLFQEETSVWKEKLKQLQGTLELQVMDRLRISYDTLSYESQQIFLDIACLFIGANKEMAFYMWSDCNFYPTSEYFTSLSGLRYFEANHKKLLGNFSNLFPSLRWLQLQYHKDESEDFTNLMMTNLVILDLESSTITDTLGACINLAEMLELEELTVEDCQHGIDIPPSGVHLWWKVSKLKLLKLSSSLRGLHVWLCEELSWLPSLENLENLTKLHINKCPSLLEIQFGDGGLKSLQFVEISTSGVTQIHGLGHLLSSPDCKLQELNIWNCSDLTGLEDQRAVESLQELSINGCPMLEVGPIVHSRLSFVGEIITTCRSTIVVVFAESENTRHCKLREIE